MTRSLKKEQKSAYLKARRLEWHDAKYQLKKKKNFKEN
jgi:hypothetical protein